MSRWIDIDDCRNCYCGSDGEYEKWNIDTDVLAEARSKVEERKKGEWMPLIEVNEVGEPYQVGAMCSECGNVESYEPNYCPMCGADMRGGDDETD